MKHYFLSFLIIGSLIFFVDTLSAQMTGVLGPESTTGFLIGPMGGINLVSYKTNSFAMLQSEPTCFTAQNGSDVAPFFGLDAQIPLGTTMQNFIVIEGLYDSKSSKFTPTNNTRQNIPTKINGNVQNGNITATETASLSYLMVNGGYKYNFTEGPSPVGPALQLCISVGLKLTSTLNKTVSISAAASDGGLQQATQTASTAVDGAQGIRIGLRGQFMYDIPLSPAWIASPLAGYDFPFTKVDNTDRAWTASSAYVGIALHYFIGK